MQTRRTKWLRTDETQELIDALEHSASLACRLHEESKIWKWLIISLHFTLQGACTCALQGNDTSGVSVLDSKSQNKMSKYFDSWNEKDELTARPAEKLAPLLELYDRVCDVNYLPSPYTLTASQQDTYDVKLLNEL